MKNIVILISGGGSNMATIVRTAQQERWEQRYGARVAAVISNKPEAAGLVFAREQGIAAEALDHKAFASREALMPSWRPPSTATSLPWWCWRGSCAS